jgi:hypothetical protein
MLLYSIYLSDYIIYTQEVYEVRKDTVWWGDGGRGYGGEKCVKEYMYRIVPLCTFQFPMISNKFCGGRVGGSPVMLINRTSAVMLLNRTGGVVLALKPP